MKISGLGSTNSTSSTTKRSGVSSTTSFADVLASTETTDVAQTGATTDIAAAALSNLLALQEISEEDVQRRKLVQQGNNMLDVLDNLRNRLLMGSLSPQVILDLSRQLSIQKQMVSDPHINAIIEDIEIRAAVELAKLQMAIKGDSK